MSNPINILTESIDKININLDSIESNINNPQSVDNVKEQICNICFYNKRLNQSYSMLYYATIVQPELAPVLAAIKSLTEILKQFCNACADYENNKQFVLNKLSPYISQLRQGLIQIKYLIDKNKKYIDFAYEKTKNVKDYFKLPYQQVQPEEPVKEPVELEPVEGGYKRRQRSRRRQSKLSKRRLSKSKRKSIKKKSKKNRRC